MGVIGAQMIGCTAQITIDAYSYSRRQELSLMDVASVLLKRINICVWSLQCFLLHHILFHFIGLQPYSMPVVQIAKRFSRSSYSGQFFLLSFFHFWVHHFYLYVFSQWTIFPWTIFRGHFFRGRYFHGRFFLYSTATQLTNYGE